MYYVITVKARRWRREYIDDPWEEFYYNWTQSYWCRNFYLATFLTDLGVAKNYLSELEYKDSEDYEYDKDSVAIKKVIICDVESGDTAPKVGDSAVCGYVLSVVSTADKLRHYFSMGGGWTRFIESALIFPAIESVEEEIDENEEIFCERDGFDLGTLAIEGLVVSPVKRVNYFSKWRWEPVSNANYRCPECRKVVEFPKDTVSLYDYCPNCGAKMIREAM